jgi:hypothetical protein
VKAAARCVACPHSDRTVPAARVTGDLTNEAARLTNGRQIMEPGVRNASCATTGSGAGVGSEASR